MKRYGLTAALAVLLATATAFGQNGSIHRENHFTYVVLSDCVSEPLAFTGTTVGRVHYTTAGDKLIMNLQMDIRDGRVTGLESGNTYNMVGHTLTRYVVTDRPANETDTMILSYEQQTKIVGLFTIHNSYTWKFTGIMGSEEWIGNVKMEAENFRTVCQ